MKGGYGEWVGGRCGEGRGGDDGKWRGRSEKDGGREKEEGGGKTLRNRRERERMIEREQKKELASLRARTQCVSALGTESKETSKPFCPQAREKE